jgi:hypothetical protein
MVEVESLRSRPFREVLVDTECVMVKGISGYDLKFSCISPLCKS